MTTGSIRLPAEGTGVRLAAYEFTEDSVAKYLLRRYPVEDAAQLGGVYYAHSGVFTMLGAAHAATAGYCWLINPVGSAVTVVLREVHMICQSPSSTNHDVATRLTLERMTFTGTASGASPTIAKRRATDGAAVASLRTASTGLTPAAGAVLGGAYAMALFTAPRVSTPGLVFRDELIVPEQWSALAAGEGVVVRQPDIGETGDLRVIAFDFVWAERTVEF